MENENHGSFVGIFAQFAMEFFNFLKYIFYDVWRGVAP